MISFLHTADLHLGLRITRFPEKTARRIREARFCALENVLRVARETAVDFILMAGDLFDDLAIDDQTVRRAFETLENGPAPIYLITGNHDPLLAGSFWDRDPWNRCPTSQVYLCRKTEPLTLPTGAILFPCPVFSKTSRDDPTQWIANHSREGKYRIGLAHGSLRTRGDLPLEDHLIAQDAAASLKLDYLALGHWHRCQFFEDATGLVRTAYPGVPEPFRFPDSRDAATGWKPVTVGATLEEFHDNGKGEVLHVTLDQPGQPPRIKSIPVNHLTWHSQERRLRQEDELHQVLQELKGIPQPEKRLLRLKLYGTLDLQSMRLLDQLRQLLDRYLHAELEASALQLEPSAEELGAFTPSGVLQRMMAELARRRQQPGQARLAERALVLLYQIHHEVTS